MPAMPAYQRVIEDIKTKISSGEWPPDHKLDPPDVLAAAYTTAWRVNVSAGTVRRATDTLQALQLLYGRQGVGVFVADHSEA
jgi:GntR family transcriptional regulator